MKDYKIAWASLEEAKPWILLKHYAGRVPSVSYAWKLIYKKMPIGILTIGKPASPSLCDGICGKQYSDKVFELNRLFIEDGHNKNALSFFVGACLRRIHNINPNGMILVSYADTAMNHIGYIYQATNWIYTGITKERTDIGKEDGTHSRHYDKNSDYSIRKFRSAKHRYVMFLGKNKGNLRKHLNYPVLPYPKGENKKYDMGNKIQKQVQMF